jgi:hypothetical protein
MEKITGGVLFLMTTLFMQSYRVKQGELDQGDAQLIENLLNFLLTIVSLLQR